MCLDAFERNESCGGHFRVEYQTEEGEALRNDDEFCHVAAWRFNGVTQRPVREIEPLVFENVKLAQRSYK
jgi:succinate dehydrogenase flavoprotein subunit